MDEKTKAKLIYVLEILKKTDENHPVNTSEILKLLEKKEIKAERKSVARDVAVLRDVGYSINLCEDMRRGYYMTDQLFEDYELKLIADAVSNAKCLTYKDSETLIKKLRSLATIGGEEIIKEQTFIDENIKTKNRAVRYNIDKVIRALKSGKKITFQYYEIGENGEYRLKRSGHTYEISPYYLCWCDGGYFMIGNSFSHDHLTHFNVDMMTGVQITRMNIRDRGEIEELKGNFSIGEYLRSNVFMYTGELIDVTMECSTAIARAVRDRFGGGIKMEDAGMGRFKTTASATEGEGLIRWISGFSAEDMTILEPEKLRKEIAERAAALAEKYK